MCLAGANAATYRLPATRLSGCKTGAPSQADVDRPDPQEVLVSKEACLQFYRECLSGAVIAPFRLWLPVTGGGKVCSRLSLFSPLFRARAWQCLRLGLAFSHGRYPTVWFASPNYFAQIALRVFMPDFYSKRCSPRLASLPSPRLLMACAGICTASPLGELP